MAETATTETACPLCGSRRRKRLASSSAVYFGARVELGISECLDCRMLYTSPRLAKVNRAYEDEPAPDPAEIERYERAKRPVFRKALRRILRRRPPPARLLDVGCGSGGFLLAARAAGYEVRGVEPGRAYWEQASDRLGPGTVENRPFEHIEAPRGSADILTAWDVLEHVADPREFVRRAFGLLSEGGLLAMRMPGALFHRIKAFFGGKRAAGRVFSPTIHLNFFSPETIRRLLEEEGFGGVSVLVTTPEGHSSDPLRRWLRLAWGHAAMGLGALTGLCLDNLEVYAVKPSERPIQR